LGKEGFTTEQRVRTLSLFMEGRNSVRITPWGFLAKLEAEFRRAPGVGHGPPDRDDERRENTLSKLSQLPPGEKSFRGSRVKVTFERWRLWDQTVGELLPEKVRIRMGDSQAEPSTRLCNSQVLRPFRKLGLVISSGDHQRFA
jgi:hypothetical protein